MIDLHRFLQVPFDDPAVSVSRLLDFSSDHLARMVANNPGGTLSARITATTTALGVVQDSVTDDQTKKAIRKARTQVKNAFRQGLPARVARVHGKVVGQYGPEAPEVTEIFPQGRKIFDSAPDDRLAQHLETMANGVAAHAGDLGAPLGTEVAGLVSQWEAIHGQSESAGGATTTTQEAKRVAREALQLELFLTLLELAKRFPRQPEKLDLYMQQSLLEGAESPDEEEPEPEPEPAVPGEATLSLAVIDSGGTLEFTMAAPGATSFRIERFGPADDGWVALEEAWGGAPFQYNPSGTPGLHRFRVTGINAAGSGPASAVAEWSA